MASALNFVSFVYFVVQVQALAQARFLNHERWPPLLISCHSCISWSKSRRWPKLDSLTTKTTNQTKDGLRSYFRVVRGFRGPNPGVGPGSIPYQENYEPNERWSQLFFALFTCSAARPQTREECDGPQLASHKLTTDSY
ncbi:hypothetical protein FHS27_000352 [Rhodopirellula rubra]|uniref:Uncharacterized protein n=1 Tax=Aporhodopirellula rubra TaxID=980271 RepID=A0A7W5DU37_9BACT|nr:hypothetical protein [Aporhodopirellula rubra]